MMFWLPLWTCANKRRLLGETRSRKETRDVTRCHSNQVTLKSSLYAGGQISPLFSCCFFNKSLSNWELLYNSNKLPHNTIYILVLYLKWIFPQKPNFPGSNPTPHPSTYTKSRTHTHTQTLLPPPRKKVG